MSELAMPRRGSPAAPPEGGATLTARAASVADLNDRFRRTFTGGRIVMTAGVAALSESARATLLAGVRGFDRFEPGNDPHGEHDFGSVDHGGERFLWKIDCYDRALRFASPNPADPAVTIRVLTIMRADEY